MPYHGFNELDRNPDSAAHTYLADNTPFKFDTVCIKLKTALADFGNQVIDAVAIEAIAMSEYARPMSCINDCLKGMGYVEMQKADIESVLN